jgi:hypothetical protein
LKKEEATEKHMPNSTGLFSDLFSNMNNEIKANKRLANDYGEAANMSVNERTISFLNRYFIYKKVRNVDADKVSLELLHKTFDDEKDEEEMSKRAQDASVLVIAKPKPKSKSKPVKLKGKLKLVG